MQATKKKNNNNITVINDHDLLCTGETQLDIVTIYCSRPIIFTRALHILL